MWEVRRRHSEFEWLRNILLKLFPYLLLPALPRKNAKKTTPRDLDKRMKMM